MKTKLNPLLLVCVFAALPLFDTPLAIAQQAVPGVQDQTYSLHAVYTKNELLIYKMAMDMKMDMVNANGASILPNGPIATNSTAKIRMKTTTVKPDGTATMVIQTSGMKVDMNGKEIMVPEPPIVTMEISKYGVAKIHGMENTNTPQMQMMMKMMNFQNMPTMAALLPKNPVKVGDTWTNVITSPMNKGADLTVNSTLVGVETINGEHTLKLSQIFTMPINMMIGKDGTPTQDQANAMMAMSGSFSVNSVANILPANARLIKMDSQIGGEMKMKMQNSAAPNGNAPQDMDMKMNMNMNMSMVKSGTDNTSSNTK